MHLSSESTEAHFPDLPGSATDGAASGGVTGEMLNAVLDTIPQPVFWKDRNLVFQGCNAAFAAAAKRSREEIIGRTDLELSPLPLAEKFRAEDLRVIESGEAVLDSDHTYLARSGNQVVESLSKLPLRDRHGRVIGVLGTYRDISQQKRAEAALHSSLERFSIAFERSASGIVIANIRNTRILRANHAFCEMLGYPEDELRGMSAMDLTHPDDLAASQAQLEALQSGAAKQTRLEKRYLHKDGHEVWALVIVAVVQDVQDQEPYYIAQVNDISDRKRAEAALKESDERLRILFDFAPDAYFLMDLESKFIDGNLAVQNLTGLSRDELIGSNFAVTDLLSGDDARRAEQVLTGLSKGAATVPHEYTLRHQDGSEVPVEVCSYPVSIGGQPVILSIARNITERKASEIQLAELNQKFLEYSRLAGMAEVATSVLHNVGNVLNSINVSSSLVSDQVRNSRVSGLSQVVELLNQHEADLAAFFSDNPKGKQLAGYLATLSGTLLAEQAKIVDELAFLDKNIEQVKEIVSMQQAYTMVAGASDLTDIRQLVEDSVRMEQRALNRHGVRVIREFEPLPPVMVDKYKVMQILVNLIQNAKHACSKVAPEDRQLTLRISRDGDWVDVEVIDTGSGIDPEHQDKLFNFGFTGREGGHGYGLYSGLLAAQEMGGNLSAHSDGLGHGACFTLSLPAEVRQGENE
jgi:PAS domain S-box-containing protein